MNGRRAEVGKERVDVLPVNEAGEREDSERGAVEGAVRVDGGSD